MTPKEKEQLILSLIKNDLINIKLVNGLNSLGLNADNYYLHLTDTIFNLMGFKHHKKREAHFEHYLQLTDKAAAIDISQSHKPMDALAVEVYTKLLGMR